MISTDDNNQQADEAVVHHLTFATSCLVPCLVSGNAWDDQQIAHFISANHLSSISSVATLFPVSSILASEPAPAPLDDATESGYRLGLQKLWNRFCSAFNSNPSPLQRSCDLQRGALVDLRLLLQATSGPPARVVLDATQRTVTRSPVATKITSHGIIPAPNIPTSVFVSVLPPFVPCPLPLDRPYASVSSSGPSDHPPPTFISWPTSGTSRCMCIVARSNKVGRMSAKLASRSFCFSASLLSYRLEFAMTSSASAESPVLAYCTHSACCQPP